jgi:opacity protein-like surface antigen
MKKTLLAVAALTALSTAHADYNNFLQQPEQPYVGIDYQVAQIDNGSEVELGSVLVRAGTQFASNIGVEVQASIGVQDDEFTNQNGTKSTAENRGSYGIFLRPSYMLGGGLNVYALAGANYNDIQVITNGDKENGYGTAFAAGAGLTFMITPTVHVGAEYMQYDSDVQAVNAGLRFMF